MWGHDFRPTGKPIVNEGTLLKVFQQNIVSHDCICESCNSWLYLNYLLLLWKNLISLIKIKKCTRNTWLLQSCQKWDPFHSFGQWKLVQQLHIMQYHPYWWSHQWGVQSELHVCQCWDFPPSSEKSQAVWQYCRIKPDIWKVMEHEMLCLFSFTEDNTSLANADTGP